MQVTDDPREVWRLTEADWAGEPFPERYRLSAGRWPQRAGEVVIAAPPPGTAAVGMSLPVFGNAAQITVVGYASDEFDDNPVLLAGPGTWAGLPGSIVDEFVLSPAQPVLFWSGNDAEQVAEAFAGAVAGLPGGVPEVVPSSGQTRERLEEQGEATWLQRSPAAFQIPAVVLPLLAVAVLFGSNAQRLRRSVSVMLSLGVRRRQAIGAAGLAVAVWAVAAALLGSGSGLGLGLALRPVLSVFAHRPAGPVAGVQTPVVSGLLAVTAAVLVGTLVLGRSVSDRPATADGHGAAVTSGAPRSTQVSQFRRLLAICVLLGVTGATPAVNTVGRVSYLSVALTTAAILLLPDIVSASLRWLPERSPRTRLARRRMLRDRSSVTTAVGLSTFLLSASLGYTVLFGSVITSLTTLNYPDVLSGQVLVQGRAPVVEPPPPSALNLMEQAGLDVDRDGTAMAYTVSVDQQGMPTGGAEVAGVGGLLLVLPDAPAVQSLLGQPLSTQEAQVLQDGGALVWEGAPDPQGLITVDVTDATENPVGQVRMPGLTIEEPRAGWSVGPSGLVLASGANAVGLPVGPASVIFLNLDRSQIDAVDQALQDSGVDANTVLTPRAPPPIIPNIGLVLTVIGLAAIAVLGAVVGTRTQLRNLRGYAAQLDSLGLPRRWIGAVLLYQTAFVAVLATILAVIIALPPILVAAANISGLDVYIPTREVLALTGAVYLATAATAVVAARRVSVQRHLGEA